MLTFWQIYTVKDCQARKFNKEDAVDHSTWREVDKGCLMIKMGDCFFGYWPPGSPGQRAIKGLL